MLFMKGCKVDSKMFWLIVRSNVYNANVMMLCNAMVLECNLCTSFALFTSLNIDVLHLIIVIYLCFTFVGAILLIGDKIEL